VREPSGGTGEKGRAAKPGGLGKAGFYNQPSASEMGGRKDSLALNKKGDLRGDEKPSDRLGAGRD